MILQFPGTRTQGLMTRVEEMEKALTARLVNNQATSHDVTSILPPIGQTKRDDAIKEDTLEHGNIGERSLDKSPSMINGDSILEDDERLDDEN